MKSEPQKNREEVFRQEELVALEHAQKIADEYYQLAEGQDWAEITEKVLTSNNADEAYQKIISATGRRFFVFKYPSDQFHIKGVISFVPQHLHSPLLIFLRGGNRLLSLPDPATDFLCLRNYTILTTTYRGGVSEGEDEFG